MDEAYYLQFDGFAIKLHSTDFKIHTNCRNIRFRVSVIGKTEQQTRFSDTGITNQQKFEQIIATLERK